MNLNCGIVGLPNVGKSTIFSALSASKAEIANYPFCTINPNVGIVNVPDSRLDRLCEIVPPEKKVSATMEFVDIAGLVKGASKGEGLGNQFLANIREVGLICHVVRCFDDPDIVHVRNKISPKDDIETVNTELILKDLDSLTKVYDKEKRLSRLTKGNQDLEALEKAIGMLGDGKWLANEEWSDKEAAALAPLFLLTMKKTIYICNCDEDGLKNENSHVEEAKRIAREHNSEAIVISGKLESELAELETPEERKEMLEALGLKESGLKTLIESAFRTLGLCEFFTIGKDENRAWVFRQGMKAPECAGIIHTDFEKKFIKAEVYSFDDIDALGSESEVKKKGLLRLEGKDYLMKDGDVVFFKHG